MLFRCAQRVSRMSGGTCAVFLLVAWACGGQPAALAGAMVLLALAGSVACVGLGRWTEKAFSAKDPSQCTVDEWAGQAVALLLLPGGANWRAWLTAAAVAFVAFRFFDILKPPPARRMERLPDGWGVLLDDLVAGLYANLASQLVLRLGLAP